MVSSGYWQDLWSMISTLSVSIDERTIGKACCLFVRYTYLYILLIGNAEPKATTMQQVFLLVGTRASPQCFTIGVGSPPYMDSILAPRRLASILIWPLAWPSERPWAWGPE